MARKNTSRTKISTHITCKWSLLAIQHKTLDIRFPSGNFMSKVHFRERERETTPTTGVAVIEGHFTLIIAASSYVNPRWVY